MGNAFAFAAGITRMTSPAGIPHFTKVQTRAARMAQRHGVPTGRYDDNGWLITLSDLTLLLLSFLAVWYVKSQELNAATQAANSVTRMAQADSGARNTLAASAHDADWSALKEEIEKFIAGADMTRDVSIAAAPNEILISFKDTVPFASGKADLRTQAMPVLEKVAAVAVSRPAMRLGVSGHTDDQPISTAEFPSNWELSSARASRVARYLIEKGVHPERIEVQGFADHRPRVPNENRTGRGANRRVELRLMRTSEASTTQNSDAQSR